MVEADIRNLNRHRRRLFVSEGVLFLDSEKTLRDTLEDQPSALLRKLLHGISLQTLWE